MPVDLAALDAADAQRPSKQVLIPALVMYGGMLGVPQEDLRFFQREYPTPGAALLVTAMPALQEWLGVLNGALAAFMTDFYLANEKVLEKDIANPPLFLSEQGVLSMMAALHRDWSSRALFFAVRTRMSPAEIMGVSADEADAVLLLEGLDAGSPFRS